ncbi:MAG: CotH kinase family protein [Spirochaetes bacterium]|nr:CotH kinase family protein [Spirochaetota bacterium]
MILINKKRSINIFKMFYFFKNNKRVLCLALILVIVLIFGYLRIFKDEKSVEQQMKEYSKHVEAPILRIDINFKNFQNILYQRRQGLRSGGDTEWNNTYKFEEVPAKISYDGAEYKADIKLKGSRKFHYADSTKMSFHINLKGGNTIMGMNKFSIHDPKMRNYIHEWIFHEFLRREGFIALKYDFIQVYINGIYAGVYAIEERIHKILLERHGYLDGPVFKIGDDTDSKFVRTLEHFSENKYQREEWKKITDKAETLAHGIFDGTYMIGKSVNSDMLARYFAICDVLMTYHGSLSKSIRLYFNPITQKFEPIGFDGHYMPGSSHFISSEILQTVKQVSHYYDRLAEFQGVLFFNENNYDKEFLESYVQYLKKYSEKKYLENFFSEIDSLLSEKTAIIYKNQPLLKDKVNSFGPEEFEISIEHINMQTDYIRNLLSFKSNVSENRLSLKIDTMKMYDKSFELEISNNYSFSIELLEVIINDSIKFVPESMNFVIPHIHASARNYKKITFMGEQALPENINSTWMYFKIAGTEDIIRERIVLYADELSLIMQDIFRKQNTIDKLRNIFTIDENKKEISLAKGKYTIDNYIVIPEGYKFIVDQGTEISLIDSSFIVSYSPVIFNGAEKDPIIINSDKTGGLFVLNNDSTSYLYNTIFKNLSNPGIKEWELTGAITFYKSPVIVEGCIFTENNCEDYLNIKHSDFEIRNSQFSKAYSDAFDADFSNGTISNTVFKNSGNDAVDVSGSKVLCADNEIVNAGDKAYSSGEGSAITIDGGKISDSEIALAAKDKSSIYAKNIEIVNCKLGFTAFQKKPEYGPGKIEVTDIEYKDVSKLMIIEIHSSVTIDGDKHEGDMPDVKDEHLYGKEYGKASVR